MLIAAAVSLAAGLLLQPVSIAALRAGGVLDRPSSRSSHSIPTVRGGGIAVVAALLIGAAAAGALREREAIAVLGAVGLCAAVGLAEDIRGVSVRSRIGLLLMACSPLALLPEGGAGLHVALAVGIIAFAIAVVNAVNFMDGINGISLVQGLVSGVAYAALASFEGMRAVAVTGVALAAASLSFAPFNVPRARVFLGDTGSYGLGAAVAGLASLLALRGVPLEAVIAPLAIYAADTSTTFVKRVRSGEPWHLPHRSHVYQRLTDQGLSHAQVSAMVFVFLIVCSASGSLAILGGPWRVLGDVSLAVVVVAYLSMPRLLARRRAQL